MKRRLKIGNVIAAILQSAGIAIVAIGLGVRAIVYNESIPLASRFGPSASEGPKVLVPILLVGGGYFAILCIWHMASVLCGIRGYP